MRSCTALRAAYRAQNIHITDITADLELRITEWYSVKLHRCLWRHILDTNSNVILQALRLLSQLLHFTMATVVRHGHPQIQTGSEVSRAKRMLGETLLKMNIHFIVTSIMTVQFTLLLVARAHCCFHCNISSVPSFNIYLQFKLPSTWFANPHKLGCMQNFTHTITTNIQVHNESVKQETTLSNAIHLLLYNQILHT